MGRIRVSSSLNFLLLCVQTLTRGFVAREPRLTANYRHQVPCFVKRPKPHTHDSIRHMLKILSSRIECFPEEIVKKNATLASVLDSELAEGIYFSGPELLFRGSPQSPRTGLF